MAVAQLCPLGPSWPPMEGDVVIPTCSSAGVPGVACLLKQSQIRSGVRTLVTKFACRYVCDAPVAISRRSAGSRRRCHAHCCQVAYPINILLARPNRRGAHPAECVGDCWADMLKAAVGAATFQMARGSTYTSYRVGRGRQCSPDSNAPPKPRDSLPGQDAAQTPGLPAKLRTGSQGLACAFLLWASGAGRGLNWLLQVR